MVRYPLDKKKQAVIELCNRNDSAESIAKSYGVPRATLYEWRRKLLSTEKIKSMSRKKNSTINTSTSLINEKAELEQQVKSLKKEVFRLQLEHDILEKSSELLKKG